MAITSYGYDGTVLEGAWAKLARFLGRDYAIGSATSLAPTIVSGVDRTVKLALGSIYGQGVLDVVDADVTLQAATLVSGTRWDTVIMRRAWGTNTSTPTIVTGTAAKAIAAGLNATPGTNDDQVIALVQITAGQQAPTAIVDLRPPYTDDKSPVGTEIMWPTDTPPAGYVLEDGQALDRVKHAALFALIGTTYGPGDGSTTFNVPSKKGRVVVGKDATQAEFDTLGETGGAKAVTLTAAEMPAHVHDKTHNHTGSSGNESAAHNHDMGHGHGRQYGATYGGAGNHAHSENITDLGTQIGSSSRKGWTGSGGDATAGAGAHDHNAFVDVAWFAGTTGTESAGHSHGVTVDQHTGNTGSVGGGGAHNNLPPYVVQNFAIRAL